MEGVASLRRIALLSLLSIPVAAQVVFGEVLFIGHIVLLVQALGFAWGLLAFIAIWAALGVVVLAGSDFVWPRMRPLLDSLLARFVTRSAEAPRRSGAKALLALLGISVVLAAAGVAMTLAGSEIRDWAVDHRADVATLLIVAAVVFPILLAVARLGRRLESWVRSIAHTAGPTMRSLATLLSMMLLGPALSWPLFRLFGYSGRSVYALTLAAAPVFGAVWVPAYGLGVWSLIEGLF